jgi:hypothetical protein
MDRVNVPSVLGGLLFFTRTVFGIRSPRGSPKNSIHYPMYFKLSISPAFQSLEYSHILPIDALQSYMY